MVVSHKKFGSFLSSFCILQITEIQTYKKQNIHYGENAVNSALF